MGGNIIKRLVMQFVSIEESLQAGQLLSEGHE
jgi:hypothetical protein